MNKLTKEKIRLLADLAYHLDRDLYLPMIEELKQYHIQHSLGFKKEQFKSYMETKIMEL